MGKKKNEDEKKEGQEDLDVQEPGVPPEIGEGGNERVDLTEPGVPTAAAADEETLYEKGTWKGHEQWRCPVCQWDTLRGADEMLARMNTCGRVDCPVQPATAEEAQAGMILVADKTGREKA